MAVKRRDIPSSLFDSSVIVGYRQRPQRGDSSASADPFLTASGVLARALPIARSVIQPRAIAVEATTTRAPSWMCSISILTVPSARSQ
jgi:hypothetical protein